MDYESYREKFFTKPPPDPRFEFRGLHGTTLYFSDFEAAIDFYTRVLGSPAYVEGQGTRGWRLGNTWLTLLKGKSGNPKNVELNIITQTPQEADRLQDAFIKAGGVGEPPSDQLMYKPVRFCPVQDPFGTNILIICPIPEGSDRPSD
jgi:catechol 2,3-dioxygenase-like lactoylglutathione lyase family enzyme